jgi:translation elongation factor EF-1alpha
MNDEGRSNVFFQNQLVVFVVPSQVTSSNKKDLKEALLALYSLAGHTNWIVVVNKMDLINFSETGKINLDPFQSSVISRARFYRVS